MERKTRQVAQKPEVAGSQVANYAETELSGKWHRRSGVPDSEKLFFEAEAVSIVLNPKRRPPVFFSTTFCEYERLMTQNGRSFRKTHKVEVV